MSRREVVARALIEADDLYPSPDDFAVERVREPEKEADGRARRAQVR